MHLFIYGPPGSGKTTLGKVLAERLALPFVDLDREVANAAGKTVRGIFETEGETMFRTYEAQTLAAVVRQDRAVIALGGGTLLRPENRALAEATGTIVCLAAPVDVLSAHIAQQPGARPLINNGLVTSGKTIPELMRERAEHYASFPNQLDVCLRSLDDMMDAAETLFGVYRIESGDAPCDVTVGNGILGGIGEWFVAHGCGQHCVVVADENTFPLYGNQVLISLRQAGVTVRECVIPAGESIKTIDTVANLWKAFLAAGIERGDTVIAVGGGVIGDLTGFAAATWLRGIRWINIPTTLLAMVDSSLGGKTGADLPDAKNMIGAFHSPVLVLADVETLTTLPVREIRCGLAEAIKHAIIGDPELVTLLNVFGDIKTLPADAPIATLDDMCALRLFVSRAMAVKILIINEDPLEKGARAKLNLGHTVGHGVEIATHLAIEHGEAVAIGTVEEARIAERMGLTTPPHWSETVASFFARVGLPTRLPEGITLESLASTMLHDKKKQNGRVRFSLPVDMGDISLHDGVYEALGL